jgi:hypothetical protein
MFSIHNDKSELDLWENQDNEIVLRVEIEMGRNSGYQEGVYYLTKEEARKLAEELTRISA